MDRGRLLTELELRGLPHSYAVAIDRRDVAGLLELFLPDALLTVVRSAHEPPEEYCGHAGLPGLFDALDGIEMTMHSVVAHQVDIDGDRATGEVACVAHHVSRRSGEEASDFVVYLRYYDAYALGEDERWRFASRRLEFGWTEVRAVRLAR